MPTPLAPSSFILLPARRATFHRRVFFSYSHIFLNARAMNDARAFAPDVLLPSFHSPFVSFPSSRSARHALAFPSSRRVRAAMRASLAFALAFACAWLLALALALAPSHGGRNACAMSFMYPSYARVPDVALASRTHALYRYDDERFAASATTRPRTSCVTATLFLPGTAGSFKQCRSFASATIALARESNANEHKKCVVEHYALDFASERSTYAAALMKRQGQSARAVMKWFHERGYRRLFVVGHSAGAAVALDAVADTHAAFADVVVASVAGALGWNPGGFTFGLHALKRDVESRWHANGAVNRVGVISVAGGERDRQVPSLETASARAFRARNESMSTKGERSALTMVFEGRANALKNVRKTLDHRSAMWCKEFVDALARGFVAAAANANADSTDDVPGASARIIAKALGFDDESTVVDDDDDMSSSLSWPNIRRRVGEIALERAPSVVACVLAHALIAPSTAAALVFASLSTSSSPLPLRHNAYAIAESFLASLFCYVATTPLASLHRERVALASFASSYLPSLFALGLAMQSFAYEDVVRFALSRDVVVAVAVAFASRRARATRATRERRANVNTYESRAMRVVAWTLASQASAPGNAHVVPLACVVAVAAG